MGTGIQARWLLGEVPWAALESSCRDIQGQAHIPLWGGPCHLLPGRAAPCGLGLETAVHTQASHQPVPEVGSHCLGPLPPQHSTWPMAI